MRAFWQRALDVYPAERRLLARFALLFFGLFLAVALWRNYVDGAFIKRYGVQEMPLMLLVNGLLTFAVLGGLARLGRRREESRLLAGFVLAYALATLGLYLLVGRGVAAAYAILFQMLYLQDSVLLVYLWNLASDRFDPRQGRRLFPLCTAAQVAGTTLGNFLTPALRSLPDPDLSLPLFGLLWLGLGLYLAGGALGRAPAPAAPARDGADGAPVRWSRIGELAQAYPVVRFLLVLGLLPNLLLPIFSYLFNLICHDAFAGEAALASFLGLFRGALSLAVFLALLLAGRAYRRMGLSAASLVQPAAFGLVFAGLGLSASLPVAAAGQFLLRLAQQAIAGPVNKVLFGLVPEEAAAWCRVFVRGTVVKLGVVLGALVMLPLGEAPPRVLVAVALAFSLWWLAETWRFHRRYRASLKQVIAAGLPDYDRLQPVSPGYHLAPAGDLTRPAGAAGGASPPLFGPGEALPYLDDPEAAVRREAALAFARSPDLRAVHRLVILLDDHETVRRAAVEALAAAGEAARPYLVAALLPAKPRVQRGILEALRRSGGGGAGFEPLPFVGRQALENYDRLAALEVLAREPASPGLALLATHLRQANQETLGLIFQALWVRHADMRLMYAALRSASAAAVVELVESALEPGLARYLVPLIDRIPPAARLERGRGLLPVRQPADLGGALNQLALAPDPLTRTLAVFAMGAGRPGREWLPTAAALLFDEDPNVRWAATYAVRRCQGQDAQPPEALTRMMQLTDLPIFAGLTLEETLAVAQLGRRESLAPGQVLATPGQPPAALYLILAGRVGLFAATEGEGSAPRAELGPGELLGAVAWLARGPARHRAVVMAPGEALAIGPGDLEEAMLLYPQIAVNLCRHLAGRLGRAAPEQA